MPDQTDTQRGRPRSEATEQAILTTARELLARSGYDGVTIEGVAREAGVGKQTIYRRYENKAQMLIAAFRDDAEMMVAFPTADTLEERLATYLTAVFKAATRSGPALKFLMAQAQIDPEFGSTFDAEFIAHRRKTLTAIIREHAETPSNTDVAASVDMIFGAMWYRLLLNHGPLNATFAQTLARKTAQGFAA